MKWLKYVRRFRTRVACGALLAGTVAALVWLRCGPLPDGLLDGPAVRSTVVRDRNGVILHEARADDGTRQVRLEAHALPDQLVKATMAAEDHRFRRHPGVDPLAIVRAAARNVWSGSREGGSTITQQTVKLLLARRDPERARTRARSWGAKIDEAILALRLEHRLTKPEILALYLNAASYGNQLAGAERASRAYFGTSASMLTPAQAAFLAALPHRPSTFNPYRDPRGAQARQKRIIGRMRDLGFISPGDATIALGERLRLSREPSSFIAPHFVEMVLTLPTETGEGARPEARPEAIDTTLDADLQRDVQGIIQRERAALDKAGAHNVAVVVLDNATGGWLAWEGSGNYHDSEHGGTINGALTPRQPGSALKPFTYALAFEDGRDPSSVLADVPSHFPTAEPGVLYSPRNYDGRFRGPLRARVALAGSENVPAVALLSDLGVPAMMRFLRHAGFSTFDKTASHYGLGLTLGNAEVRLDELVGAYAAFARGGEWIRPHAVAPPSSSTLLTSKMASTSTARERERAPFVSERTAFWITDVLSDPEARAYAFGRGGSLEFPFPVAVKTGTSQAYRDNWTIGYTREVTVGVWVGNFDREPLRSSSGVAGAGPIFHSVMMAAVQRLRGHVSIDDQPLMPAPASVTRSRICALSGMRANEWCPMQTNEWTAAEADALPCSWHHHVEEGLLTIWPDRYRTWARAEGLLHDRPALTLASATSPQSESATSSESATATTKYMISSVGSTTRNTSREGSGGAVEPLEIANPAADATYMIDPTLRAEFQTLPLRASGVHGGEVYWSVDGVSAGRSSSDTPLHWPLAVGRHKITARDSRGRTAAVSILVK
jgi:penicillin-binding protein 1C